MRDVERVAAMSASGHKQKSHDDFIMSVLTPTADIRAQRTIGRKVPRTDICSAAKAPLFDRQIGADTGPLL
jgi:hypothetical protein